MLEWISALQQVRNEGDRAGLILDRKHAEDNGLGRCRDRIHFHSLGQLNASLEISYFGV